MAERFGAGVIGVTAVQPMQVMYGDGYMSGDVIEQDRAIIEQQCTRGGGAVRAAMHNRVAKLQWRSTIGYVQLADCVADQAPRCRPDADGTGPEPVAIGIRPAHRHR